MPSKCPDTRSSPKFILFITCMQGRRIMLITSSRFITNKLCSARIIMHMPVPSSYRLIISKFVTRQDNSWFACPYNNARMMTSDTMFQCWFSVKPRMWYVGYHPPNSHWLPPLHCPDKSTTNRWPESGKWACLLASPLLAPQWAVVTYSWSLFGPGHRKGSQVRQLLSSNKKHSPPKQHAVIFSAVGKNISMSIVPAVSNLMIREPPHLRILLDQWYVEWARMKLTTEHSIWILRHQRIVHHKRFVLVDLGLKRR